jgi:hypothetical protein
LANHAFLDLEFSEASIHSIVTVALNLNAQADVRDPIWLAEEKAFLAQMHHDFGTSIHWLGKLL